MKDSEFSKFLAIGPMLALLAGLFKVSWSANVVDVFWVTVFAVVVIGLVALLRPGSGRHITLHTHGGHGTRTAAKHESGHYRMAKAVGATGVTAQIFPDGSGVTHMKLPRNLTPEQRVAIDVSGAVAAGTNAGCSSDFHFLKQGLKDNPRKERPRIERDGRKLASRTLGGSGMNREAKLLLKNGQI